MPYTDPEAFRVKLLELIDGALAHPLIVQGDNRRMLEDFKA